jgi:dinuclear metal center YbgI/SA1388 family protein
MEGPIKGLGDNATLAPREEVKIASVSGFRASVRAEQDHPRRRRRRVEQGATGALDQLVGGNAGHQRSVLAYLRAMRSRRGPFAVTREHPRTPTRAPTNPSILRGFAGHRFKRNIGAPRFELGTSPTRTVRATRLRHAPMRGQYSTPLSSRDVPGAATIDILRELDTLLEPSRFADYGPNGLQVPGAAQVETVATGVSAHLELFERAAAEQAQLLLVHHGLFWGSRATPIDAQLKRRLRVLFEANIALAAYHLPLDAHATLGNNALIARELGASAIEPFALHEGEPIGFVAQLAAPDEPGGVAALDLFARVREVTAREPLVFDAGPPTVHRVAIVSGGGSDYIADAAAAGADAFLTGEPSERVMAQARELGMHYIAAGHYATETFGVRALGERIAARFGVRHVFIDVPNPI